MNKKKFRKLSLTTETLRNLNEPELKNVAGASIADTLCTGACSECTAVCSNCTRGCSICCL
jgi:hypothetical protein